MLLFFFFAALSGIHLLERTRINKSCIWPENGIDEEPGDHKPAEWKRTSSDGGGKKKKEKGRGGGGAGLLKIVLLLVEDVRALVCVIQ